MAAWAQGFYGPGGRYDLAKRARGRELSPGHLNTCRLHVARYLIPAFGAKRLSAITPMELEQYFLDWYARGTHSGSTLNGVLKVVKGLFSEAERLGLLRENPCRRIGKVCDKVFSYPTTNPHEAYRPYEYPTTTVSLLKFKNGRTLGKVASMIDAMQPYVFHMNLVGSHGALKNNLFYSKKIEGLKDWSTLDLQLVDSGDVAHHPYREQFADFAACLDAGRDPHNNAENAFETHRVAYAADRSAASGKPVRLSEFSY